MPRRNPAGPIQRLSVVTRGRCRRPLALLLLVSGLLLAGAASASAESKTFTPTGGAEQEFVVPGGVTHIEVSAVGGAGHAGHSCDSANEPSGGAGAKVTAQLTVKPGQKLYVDFGGGGAGGAETTGCGKLAGAGGGASDLREEPGGNVLKSLQSRLLVAGGGGGVGDNLLHGVAAELADCFDCLAGVGWHLRGRPECGHQLQLRGRWQRAGDLLVRRWAVEFGVRGARNLIDRNGSDVHCHRYERRWSDRHGIDHLYGRCCANSLDQLPDQRQHLRRGPGSP